MRGLAFAIVCAGSLLVLATTRVFAQSEPTLAPDAKIEIAPGPEAPAPRANTDEHGSPIQEGEALAPDRSDFVDLAEAPPPSRPRRHGVVLESTAGMLGFGGQFRHLAPPAYWMHGVLGYELFSWLMLFGEAELALTSTSEAEDPSHARAFPIWGFGGGARIGWRGARLGAFVEGDVGALSAIVPHDALTYLGFPSAEALGIQYGGRVGIEWYHRDRHIAVTLQGGPRIAQGFSRFRVSGDVPLMWDTALGLRYTF